MAPSLLPDPHSILAHSTDPVRFGISAPTVNFQFETSCIRLRELVFRILRQQERWRINRKTRTRNL